MKSLSKILVLLLFTLTCQCKLKKNEVVKKGVLEKEVFASKEIVNFQNSVLLSDVKTSISSINLKYDLNTLNNINNYKYPINNIIDFKEKVSKSTFNSFETHIYVGELLSLTNDLFLKTVTFKKDIEISELVNKTTNTKLKFKVIQMVQDNWINILTLSKRIDEISKNNKNRNNEKTKSHLNKITILINQINQKYFQNKIEILKSSTSATNYLIRIVNNIKCDDLISSTQKLTEELSGLRYSNYKAMIGKVSNENLYELYK